MAGAIARAARAAVAAPPAEALAAAAAAMLAAAALPGCCGPSQRDVRGTVLTESGAPIPGAVFYAEAWDGGGPFAFVAMTTGTAGEVPQSAREASKIDWRPGARVAVAAFADGYVPAVVREPEAAVRTDGALVVLRPVPEGESGWNPAVADLQFPFPDAPELAARARAPEHAALRRALLAAWEARPAGALLSEAQERKLSLLSAMDPGTE
jgi:hypothetical protein